MKNIYLIMAVVMAVAVSVLYYFDTRSVEPLAPPEPAAMVYSNGPFVFSEGTTTFTVSYNGASSMAKVEYAGEIYELNRVVSGSGSQYANEDESVVFFESEGEVLLEISGEAVTKSAQLGEPETNSFDPQNSTIVLEGESVTLVDGLYERPTASGSATMITVRYFGNEAYGELTGDDNDDMAYLVTYEDATSTFYYAVVAHQTDGNYETTSAFLVGDQIAPQSTEIRSDSRELRVNYAERLPDEPMTAEATQAVTLLLRVTPEGVLEGLIE